VIGGLLALIVANAAATLGAWALARRMAPQGGLLEMSFLRLLLVSVSVLAFGAAGLLSPLPLGIAGILALAFLIRCGEHRTLPRLDLRSLPRGALLLAGALLLRLVLQAWFFAPYTTDVLSYHLPKVAEWVRSGSLFAPRGIDDHAALPAGFERVEAWWTVFLHHDVLIEFAGIEFLVLAALAGRSIARSLGLGERDSWIAALVVALVPGLHHQATACMNDGAVAALVGASAAFLMAGRPWPLALAAFALGVGVKPTAAFAAPGLLWLAWRRTGTSTRPALGLLLPALVLGAWDYVRNAIEFGSPLHPAGAPGVPLQSTVRVMSLVRSAGLLFRDRLLDDAAPLGPHLDHLAGWGAPALALGLVGLVAALFEDRRWRRPAAALTLSAATVLACVSSDAWFGRFLLFVPVLLAVSAARLASTVPGARPLLVLALVSAAAGTFLPYDLPRAGVEALASQSWRERTTAPRFGAELSGERPAYIAQNRGPAYLLYRPDFSRGVVYVQDPRELAGALRGADALFTGPLSAEQQREVERLVRSGLLQPLSERTYRVRP
jgi:hypothetical protein